MTDIGHQCSRRASGVASTCLFRLVLGFFSKSLNSVVVGVKCGEHTSTIGLYVGSFLYFICTKFGLLMFLSSASFFSLSLFFSPRFPLLLLGTDADDGAFFEELYLHKKEDFLS